MNFNPMDLALAFQIAMTLVAFLGGWLVKTLFERMKDIEHDMRGLTKEVGQLRVDLPSYYTRRDEFKELGDNIFESLRRIEDKIDRKADKP